MTNQPKLMILDRDGVINYDSPNYIKSADEWKPLPGSVEAIAKASKAGWIIALATNQSGLGRKLFTEEALNDMHNKLKSLVEQQGGKIDCIFYCEHHPDEQCECRKPKPGLLKKIESHTNLPLKQAVFIGDSIKDLQAGNACGCTTVLVKTGNGKKSLHKLGQDLTLGKLVESQHIFSDLAHAVEYFIRATKS